MDCTIQATPALKAYLLSSASVNDLGAKAEEKLQHSPDYEHCKEQIVGNQKTLAFWDGVRGYSSLAGGLMTGVLGGAIMAAAKGGDFSSMFSDPIVLGSSGGVAALTGLNIYANYNAGQIHTQNNFCQNEAGARKGAEMGRLHAMHTHELSLATSEFTARRVGEEVEKAMERSFAKHHPPLLQTPDPHVAQVESVTCNQCAKARA